MGCIALVGCVLVLGCGLAGVVFNAHHVSDVNTSILRSLRLIAELFHALYCSGTKCVGVTLWFAWDGV